MQGSNTDNLCGFNNWRVPAFAELSSIVNKGTFNPAIDVNYFLNTVPTLFWSSSPITVGPSAAWSIYFAGGGGGGSLRDGYGRVRLVRSGQ